LVLGGLKVEWGAFVGRLLGKPKRHEKNVAKGRGGEGEIQSTGGKLKVGVWASRKEKKGVKRPKTPPYKKGIRDSSAPN